MLCLRLSQLVITSFSADKAGSSLLKDALQQIANTFESSVVGGICVGLLVVLSGQSASKFVFLQLVLHFCNDLTGLNLDMSLSCLNLLQWNVVLFRVV